MISLEQVRALEDRVEKAVAYIASLREEGAELKRRLAEAQSSIDAAAQELSAVDDKIAEAEQKASAAEQRASSAEDRAAAAEELRRAEAQAVAGRVREFESRISDMAERVAAAETRAAELSARAEEYRKDQSKIEEGIVHALQKLDSFEDLVLSAASPSEEAATQSVQAAVAPPAAEPAKGSAGQTDGGIAVKAAPEGEEDEESVENELDIF